MLAFRSSLDLRIGITIAPEGRPISEPRLESGNLGLNVRAIGRTLSRLSHCRCQAEQKHRDANSCSYHEMPSLDYAPIVSLNLQILIRPTPAPPHRWQLASLTPESTDRWSAPAINAHGSSPPGDY